MQTTTTPAGARRGYRAGFDGLRAIAVALVVAFHADWELASGGFVGVDVFFVLSGYLVTGILVDGLLQDGVVGFRRFYSRRIRRLLPAAVVVLVVSAIAFNIVAAPVTVTEARGSFAAAFLYVANWWFIRESTEYLGSDIDNNPILHFWSLAIEEQFYLLWPLIIAGVHRVASRMSARPLRALIGVVVVAGVASLAAALVVGDGALNRAYYGTDTRAYQLLLGALLSLLPPLAVGAHRRLAAVAGSLALGAVVLLATDVVSLSAITRGAAAAAAAGLLILVMESDADIALNRLLSIRPLVEIGRLSYGIYLWHLPAMFLLRDRWELTPIQLMISAGAAAGILAALSGRLLEGPIRHGRRLDPFPVPVIAVGLAISLIGGLMIIPAALEPETSVTVTLEPKPSAEPTDGPVEPGGSTPTAAPRVLELDWQEIRDDRGYPPDCRATDVAACTVVEGDGAHVLLIGDSHVRAWNEAFIPYAQSTGLTLSVASMDKCSWHLDTMVPQDPVVQEECFSRQHEWLDEIVPVLSPDVVVLIYRATFDPVQTFWADQQQFLDATDTTIAQLLEDVPHVMILEPTPIANAEADPVLCLSEGRPPDECGFDATVEVNALVQRYRQIAQEDPRVVSVDLDRLPCPRFPRCDAIIGDLAVFRDHTHITATYAAESMAPQLIELDPIGAILDGRSVE